MFGRILNTPMNIFPYSELKWEYEKQDKISFLFILHTKNDIKTWPTQYS